MNIIKNPKRLIQSSSSSKIIARNKELDHFQSQRIKEPPKSAINLN